MNNVVDKSWIDEFLKTSSDITDVHDLAPYFKIIIRLINCKEYDTINEFFSIINTNNLSNLLLVGLLRLTYQYRTFLPEWFILLDKCQIELDNRGFESRFMLRGLL